MGAAVMKIEFNSNPVDGDFFQVRMGISGSGSLPPYVRYYFVNAVTNGSNGLQVLIQPTLALTLQQLMAQVVGTYNYGYHYESPNIIYVYDINLNVNRQHAGSGGTPNSSMLFSFSDVYPVIVVPPVYAPVIYNPYVNVAFTLDKIDFACNANLSDSYIEISGTITVFDLTNGESVNVLFTDKIALRDKKAYVNYGHRVHQVMAANFKGDGRSLLLKIGKLNLTATEKNISTNYIIHQTILKDIEFVAGRSTNLATQQLSILQVNKNLERIYVKNNKIVNGFGISKNFTNEFWVNDDLPTSFVTFNEILGSFGVQFGALKPGDICHIRFKENQSDYYSETKSFVVFPTPLHFNTIFWENEFLQLQSFDFGGAYSLKSEYEYITQNLYQNLDEQLEILDTKKTSKLTIDTGWCLKTDQIVIDSILTSKRVWMVANGHQIELRPISKSLSNFNSQDDTISFSLEFLINRKSNEETYSF